jgi:hypothetical protein
MKNLLLFFVAMITLTYTSQATARLQVIHNSADLAAASVDVWLDNTLLLDNFAFRTATPFIDAPSGVNFKISIQPSSSTDTVNALFTKTFNLQDGKTYVVIANGIVSGSGYSPATPFDLYAYDMGREAATSGSNTDILVFHGSTDAPVVDVKEVAAGAGTIVDDLAYGSFAGYLELPTADYSLQIRDAHGITTVAQFDAPLATLGLNGAAAVAVASGFLDPGMNSNGPAFGIYVALPSGGDLVALPSVAISTARVQVIHNSADAAASVVDVWLNDIKLIDNFEFRTATPYVDAPAGVPITISIKDASSTDPSNPIASFNYTLTGGMTYQIIANGIVSSSGYNPAPAFNLDVFAGAREKVNAAGNVDVLVYHGSTDAPTVDVVETGVGAGTIVDNLSYSQFAGYLELAPLDYKLEVRDETGTVTVVSYDAPLATLGLENFALTVLASGFLDPSMNSNGPSFGLYAALSAGGPLVALPVATGINDVLSPVSELAVYPNPATDQITVQYALRSASDVKIELKNMIGQTVKTIDAGNKTAGSYSQQIEFKSLNDGLYLLNVKAGKENYATKIVVN